MTRQASEQIYREEALEHFSTPEQLDHLLRIVTLKSWIPLAAIAGGVLAVLVWSIVGRIPVTVEGQGLLLRPEQVMSFQAPSSGQLTGFTLSVGDQVTVGQELGGIDQPDLQQRLVQERVRLEQLIKRDEELRAMWGDRRSLEQDWIESTQERLQSRAASVRQTATKRRAKSEDYFHEQTQNLAQIDVLTNTLGTRSQEHYERVKQLATQENATEAEVTEAQRSFFDNQMKIAEVGLRKHALELQRLEAEDFYQQQIDLILELELEVEALSVDLVKSKVVQRESASTRHLEIQETQRNIKRFEEELGVKGRITNALILAMNRQNQMSSYEAEIPLGPHKKTGSWENVGRHRRFFAD